MPTAALWRVRACRDFREAITPALWRNLWCDAVSYHGWSPAKIGSKTAWRTRCAAGRRDGMVARDVRCMMCGATSLEWRDVTRCMTWRHKCGGMSRVLRSDVTPCMTCRHSYGGTRLNDCSMKHYIVQNIALFSHAHVTISAEINLTHACSRGEASRSNCHSMAWRRGIGKLFWRSTGYGIA